MESNNANEIFRAKCWLLRCWLVFGVIGKCIFTNVKEFNIAINHIIICGRNRNSKFEIIVVTLRIIVVLTFRPSGEFKKKKDKEKNIKRTQSKLREKKTNYAAQQPLILCSIWYTACIVQTLSMHVCIAISSCFGANISSTAFHIDIDTFTIGHMFGNGMNIIGLEVSACVFGVAMCTTPKAKWWWVSLINNPHHKSLVKKSLLFFKKNIFAQVRCVRYEEEMAIWHRCDLQIEALLHMPIRFEFTS